jgi:hypothetical protein
MFFDTNHNSIGRVLSTLRGTFSETANKMWAYIRGMARAKRPRSRLVIRKLQKRHHLWSQY